MMKNRRTSGDSSQALATMLRNRIRELEEAAAAAPSPHVLELMRRFDEEVTALKQKAEAEAEERLGAARAQAEDILREARIARETAGADAAAIVAAAQEDADRVLREERSKAEESLRRVESSRETLVSDLARMRDLLLDMLVSVNAALGGSDERPAGKRDRLVVVDEPTNETTDA